MAPPDEMDRFKNYIVYGTAAATVLGALALLGVFMWLGIIGPDVGVPAIMVLAGGAAQLLFGAIQSRQTEKAIERANIVARSTISNENGDVT